MATASTRDLIRKIAAGNYSDEDLAIFLEAVREMDKASFHEAYQLLYEEIGQYSPDELAPNFKDALEMRLDALERSKGFLSGNLAEGQELGAVVVRRRWWRYAAAAVLLIVAGAAWWFTQSRGGSVPPVAETGKPADIAAPSRSRATLTLSSGQQVDLDSAASGALATQGGAQIVKGTGSQLAYQLKVEHPGVLLFNTLTNPRGSQVVNLTLSDGTNVWLNAESSIRYPAVFFGSDRTVEMTGEAYFEVAKNADKPFKVTVKGTEEVDVLGTSFDINAYDDEKSVKTTLLEGSVRVAARRSPPIVGINTGNNKLSVVLKPGQQAQLVVGENTNNRGRGLRVEGKADIEQAVAWKNGLFSFSDADLPAVMRELARWYNVDVSYEGNIPKRAFNGTITRSLTLNQLLTGLARSRVHYTIDSGNKLVIRP